MKIGDRRVIVSIHRGFWVAYRHLPGMSYSLRLGWILIWVSARAPT